MICQVCKKEVIYARLRHIGFHADAVNRRIDMDIAVVCPSCDDPKRIAISEAAQKVLEAPITNDNASWLNQLKPRE